MRHAKHKKGRDKTAATIGLCFCLIALTSLFTIQASIDKVNESAQNLPVSQQTSAEKADKETPKEEAQSSKYTDPSEAADLPVSTNIPTVDSAGDDTGSAASPSFLPPVNLSTASITKDYSMDMVIYNKTLDQYMTHSGIDLNAPSGSSVNAIADGIITAVYEDDAYGATIEITHDDGMISKYASLETTSMAEVGDSVSQGQLISTIGKSAPYESMDACHLHFELYKDGELCDPADYITFE